MFLETKAPFLACSCGRRPWWFKALDFGFCLLCSSSLGVIIGKSICLSKFCQALFKFLRWPVLARVCELCDFVLVDYMCVVVVVSCDICCCYASSDHGDLLVQKK